jgi:urease subunit alpha
MRSAGRPMPRCSAPHVGDRCAWPTPNSGSRSRRTSPIYGEEVKFGGGKVIRDGMGQSQRPRRGGRHGHHQCADRRSLGHRQGRHRHQGRAHRRHRQGRQPGHAAGRDHRHRPGTEVIAGEGMILTAGGIDSHIHFICPQQIEEALMSASPPCSAAAPARPPAPTPPPARRGPGTSPACCRPPTPFR